jgi:hypothetical protein
MNIRLHKTGEEPPTLLGMRVMNALSAECREIREQSKVKRSSIAHAIDKDQTAVDRFERQQVWPAGREIDDLVDAYSRLTEVPTVEIWQGTLERAFSQTLQEFESDEQAEADQTMREIEAADTGGSVGKQGPGSRVAKATKRKAG